VVFLLWFIAGARLVHVGALMILFVAGIGILAWQTDYARHRITDYMEQWKEEPVESYQLRQGKVAMVSGGVWGTGIGGGMTTLPDRHTDFIFSIIGEETGFVGGVLTLLAYSALIALGLSIAFRCEDLLGTLLAAGITILVGSQAVLNLCVTTGVAPTTGIGLPLISYGGSSLVTTLAAVGILVNIGRSNEGEVAA
jgi:cell division protein FtsW